MFQSMLIRDILEIMSTYFYTMSLKNGGFGISSITSSNFGQIAISWTVLKSACLEIVDQRYLGVYSSCWIKKIRWESADF